VVHSIPFHPEKLLRANDGIGVWARGTGQVGEVAGDGGPGCKFNPALVRVAQATRLYRPATRRTEWEQSVGAGRDHTFFPSELSVVPIGGSPTGAGESPELPMLKTRCTFCAVVFI